MDSLPRIALVVATYESRGRTYRKYMIELEAKQVVAGLMMSPDVKYLKTEMYSRDQMLGKKFASAEISYLEYMLSINELNNISLSVTYCDCAKLAPRCEICLIKLQALKEVVGQ